MYWIVFFTFVGLVSIAFIVFLSRAILLSKAIQRREQKIISLYKEKIDKIPAFIEIMSKHTAYKDIFLELIHLHKVAIISHVGSIYDLLENNSRIHREFLFLMKVSARIQDLHRNGNFLYIRDFIIFYENTLSKELLFLNSDIECYNRLLQKKNLTIVGLLFPFKKRMKTSV
ncbi:MAG: hypothetical protein PHH16_01630 [Candidatus Gracilibacteria bacterium]|nr:hypothetical protein [Candidatus Gracilibacteria bacterium]